MAAGSRLEEVLRPARALPPDRAWRARAVTVDDAQAAPTRANGRLFAAVLSLMLTARPWGLARFLQPGYVVTLGARHRLQRERDFLVRVGSCAERQRHPGEEEDEDRRGHGDRDLAKERIRGGRRNGERGDRDGQHGVEPRSLVARAHRTPEPSRGD